MATRPTASTLVKLERLRLCARAVLEQHYRPDCCVAATRAGLEVLRAVGVQARPLFTRALAMNAEWAAGKTEAPAWCVMVDPIPNSEREGVAGHLVIAGKARGRWFLLDLSAYQMDRPARGIHVPEAVLVDLGGPLRPGWDAGANLEAGGVIAWAEHPRPTSLEWQTPDWTLPTVRHQSTHREAVAEMLRAIEEE